MNEKTKEKIVAYLGKILKKDIPNEMVENGLQFVKFCVVGVTNTIVSYVINVLILLLMRPMQLSWDYIAGNVVAFVLSVLWSFYWNNRFVFTVEEGRERSVWKALAKTYISYGFTGIVLNNVLSWFWIYMLDVSKYIAPLFNLIISIPINFLLNKLWAFKSDENNERS